MGNAFTSAHESRRQCDVGCVTGTVFVCTELRRPPPADLPCASLWEGERDAPRRHADINMMYSIVYRPHTTYGHGYTVGPEVRQ
jgi:hypothetical protein